MVPNPGFVSRCQWFLNIHELPSRELTYPILPGEKEIHLQKCLSMGYVSSQEGIHLHSVSYAIFKHGFSLVCPTARMRLECRPQQRFRRSPACFSRENRWNMYPIDIQGHLLRRYLDLPNLPKTSKTSGGMTGCLGVYIILYISFHLFLELMQKRLGEKCGFALPGSCQGSSFPQKTKHIP